MFEGAYCFMVPSCTVVSARTLSCHWSMNTFHKNQVIIWEVLK